MRGGRSQGWGMMVLFLVAGAVIGGVLGEVLKDIALFSGIMPYLTKAYPVFDLAPVTVNLGIIRLSLGLALNPNLLSILGAVLGFVIFRKL